MKSLKRLMLLFAFSWLAAGLCLAQSAAAKKSYTFHGKVVSVDKAAKTLNIDGEKVEGWMEAMTMNYKVDDPSVVDKLKAGDRVIATVYDGDYVLHNVRVEGKASDK